MWILGVIFTLNIYELRFLGLGCARNAISVGIIEKIVLPNQNDLSNDLLDSLSRAVASTSIKKFKIGRTGEWFTY